MFEKQSGLSNLFVAVEEQSYRQTDRQTKRIGGQINTRQTDILTKRQIDTLMDKRLQDGNTDRKMKEREAKVQR